MQYRDFKIGPGPVEVKLGDFVTVHYTSKSLYGRLLEDSDTTYPAGVTYKAGDKSMPIVLSEGVIGMREGGKREIVAPPNTHFPEEFGKQVLIYEINLTFLRST
jgi:FKBP-type peptidyl-prolyl cis-trans isomerase 2